VLKNLRSQLAGIVQLVNYKKLSVEIGGIDVPMPALILTPCGVSVELHLASQPNKDKNEAVLKIGKELVAALDFIHGRGYNHNDVSPKNIMFDRSRGKVFLIDFGLASLHSKTIKGICGTPRYAHRDVFGKYPSKQWQAKPLYDKSSLAYSMADLSRNGQHLWKSFQPFDFAADKNAERKVDFNSWAEKRSSTAWSSLQWLGSYGALAQETVTSGIAEGIGRVETRSQACAMSKPLSFNLRGGVRRNLSMPCSHALHYG